MREFHKAAYRGETHGRREGGVAMKAPQVAVGWTPQYKWWQAPRGGAPALSHPG